MFSESIYDLIAGYDVSVGADVYKTRKSFEVNRNLISEIQNSISVGSVTSVVSSFSYQNDAIGRRTNRIDSGLSPATNAFGYNIRSELVDADMGTNAYGYAYDPIGNRQTYTNNAEVWTYLANELNQYTNVADGVTETPTYDADGNMLTYGGWTFGWNGENRLINASNSSHTISYSYDYMGRRFQKVVDDGSSVTTNTFLYDGWLLVSEQSASGGNLSTNHYVWGLDLSGSMQGAGGIGGLLATVQDGEAYFSCFDANGNLTDYVDDTGSNVAQYVYGPFGQTIASSGTKAADFRFRFSTKYHDDETALYYYGQRYYSPELGRWPSRDPIEEEGGLNVYGFAGNDSVNDWDMHGLIFGIGKPSWKKCPKDSEWVFKDLAEIPRADGCSNPFKGWIAGTAGKGIAKLFPGIPSYSGNPDEPWEGASFLNACNFHDYCYSDCDASQSECDKGLRDRALKACSDGADAKSFTTSKAKKKWLTKCEAWANAYYKAVKVAGGSAYKARQQKACECQRCIFSRNRIGFTCKDGIFIYPPENCPPCKNSEGL